MPGLFSLTESFYKLLAPWMVSMKLMGSRELLSLWVAVFAVVWSVLGAVSEEVALFAKVAMLFCRNELVSYDSLLSVNAAVRLH